MKSNKKEFIGAINLITIDMIYLCLAKLPGLGEEVSTHHFEMQLGGGPAAALVTAARFGAETKLATCLIGDTMSVIGQSFLNQEEIKYKSFSKGIGKTSPVNISSVFTFKGLDRSFVSYFPDYMLGCENKEEIYEYLKEAKICVTSEPCTELIKKLYNSGCKIAFDVGWSEHLNIDDLKETLKYVYLFTPNDKEAMKMTGKSTAEQALVEISKHVENAAVKIGEEGVLLYRKGKILRIPPANFVNVDSTGAGDAFLGGVIYGLYKDWELEKSILLGSYAGGNATTQIGCLKARCSIHNAMDFVNAHKY